MSLSLRRRPEAASTTTVTDAAEVATGDQTLKLDTPLHVYDPGNDKCLLAFPHTVGNTPAGEDGPRLMVQMLGEREPHRNVRHDAAPAVYSPYEHYPDDRSRFRAKSLSWHRAASCPSHR